MQTAHFFQVQSTLILLVLYMGLFFRKDRKRHIKLMLTGIIWDVLLILQIELSRGAIAKAAAALENPWLLNFHVSIAVLTVVGYLWLISMGRKIMHGKRALIPLHKRVGLITICLRTLTYVTSFYVVAPK